jgi:hypothetical protein
MVSTAFFVVLLFILASNALTREYSWHSGKWDENDSSNFSPSVLTSELNKRGVTVTSARFHNSSDPMPRWVFSMLPMQLRRENNQSNIFNARPTRDEVGIDASCLIELYGIMPKTTISEGHGYLNISESRFEWFCLFAHSWVRREGLVAHDTMRPVFVVCAPNSTIREVVAEACSESYSGLSLSAPSRVRVRDSSGYSGLSLSAPSRQMAAKYNLRLVVEPHNPKSHSSMWMQTLFEMTSPAWLQAKSPRPLHEVGVVAIAPYRDRLEDAGILISNWIFHHASLGFQVFFYDRNATYRDLVANAIDHFSNRSATTSFHSFYSLHC